MLESKTFCSSSRWGLLSLLLMLLHGSVAPAVTRIQDNSWLLLGGGLVWMYLEIPCVLFALKSLLTHSRQGADAVILAQPCEGCICRSLFED